jgi:hypothetical protein
MVSPWQFIGWQWWAGALATPIALWCALPFHTAAWRQLRPGVATHLRGYAQSRTGSARAPARPRPRPARGALGGRAAPGQGR